jgi:hypothetical protein
MDGDSKNKSLLKRSKNPEMISKAIESKLRVFLKIDDGASQEAVSI